LSGDAEATTISFYMSNFNMVVCLDGIMQASLLMDWTGFTVNQGDDSGSMSGASHPILSFYSGIPEPSLV